jgi:hypothetical protein
MDALARRRRIMLDHWPDPPFLAGNSYAIAESVNAGPEMNGVTRISTGLAMGRSMDPRTNLMVGRRTHEEEGGIDGRPGLPGERGHLLITAAAIKGYRRIL